MDGQPKYHKGFGWSIAPPALGGYRTATEYCRYMLL